jgi:DNA-binding beta-propeller fold protein YncE
MAASAQAATSYAPAGEFAAEAFVEPTRLAVDEQSGNVLVVDSGNDRIQVYGPGPAPTLIASFGQGQLSSPYGIAIDQDDGDVYVSDAGNERIARFTGDGAPVPTYSLDPTYESPTQGSDAEEGEIESFASPIAIDPLNGHLLVADTVGLQVARFTPGGTFVDGFDGAGSERGPFTSLLDIAIGSEGEVYVVRDGVTSAFDGVENSRVERFAANGTGGRLLGSAGELDSARSLAFDPRLGNLAVATGGGFAAPFPRLHVFHDGAVVDIVPYPRVSDAVPREEAPVALAFDGGSSGLLYALTDKVVERLYGETTVQALSPISIPTLAPPALRMSAFEVASVHLTASVDPLGRPLTYRFEYSADDGSTWASTPEQSAGSGNGPVQVEADLQLAVETDYQARLVITTHGASRASALRTFSTPRTPVAITARADHLISGTAAKLHGLLEPLGFPTTYRFEYGPTDAYGSRTPEVSVGEGEGLTAVSRLITGLAPKSTYHFRLRVENIAGVEVGEDKSFTTASAPVFAPLPSAMVLPGASGPKSRRCTKPRRLRQVKGKARCVKPHRQHRHRR